MQPAVLEIGWEDHRERLDDFVHDGQTHEITAPSFAMFGRKYRSHLGTLDSHPLKHGTLEIVNREVASALAFGRLSFSPLRSATVGLVSQRNESQRGVEVRPDEPEQLRDPHPCKGEARADVVKLTQFGTTPALFEICHDFSDEVTVRVTEISKWTHCNF